jgi:hypothetical protein
MSLAGPQVFPACFEEEKISDPCWESNNDFSDVQPVGRKK